MHSRGLSLNASYTRYGMFQEIHDIVLVGRASQYGGGKCPEPARPSLKTRGKIKAVAVAQKRRCHGNSQSIGAVWFIPGAVRNDDRRISSSGGIDFANHVIPCVSGSGWFGEANKLNSAGRTKLIRKRGRKPLGYT